MSSEKNTRIQSDGIPAKGSRPQGHRPTKKNGKIEMVNELDKKFWTHFSKVVWQKKAIAYQNLQSPLRQIDENQIFKMLVEYSNLCRQRKSAEGFKLYLEGERQHELDTLQFLPVKRDQSLLGYHRRMEKLFPDYCLVCDELLQVSQECFGLLTEFTQDLYREIGFPNRFSELGLYLGNYRKTPFGVHVDGCGVFSFPVVGTKEFRIWSPEYVRKNPDLVEAHEYNEFKKHSQVLKAYPGDMTYWPSQAWHIAESDGSFSATWSLGVWVDLSFEEVLSQTLKTLLSQKLGKLASNKTIPYKSVHKKSGQMEPLPEIYQRAASLIHNLKIEEVEDLLLLKWMASTSRQGLKNFPNFITSKKKRTVRSIKTAKTGATLQKVLTKSNLKLSWISPILFSKLNHPRPGQWAFSFAGKIFLHPSSKNLLQLIEDLNMGHICRVADYIKGPTSQRDLKFLQQLCNAGAYLLQ